ncbi:movement protein [Sesamum angolense]|uniref:Movement protein n=1 Tax=Sesamum angolense TaxID=2727404 RepID=A0AAE1XH62_9LAMI|nr:movement protein [Sesamum angolense]
MDLQPSQNSHDEEDRLQTSESLSGFFSRMTVSNKTMERIMRQDSNLSPYDGFRIGGIGKVLNQIGLNQRKHHIIYKVSSGEFAIPIEFTGNVMEMQLIPKEEILEELSRLREEVAVTMKWIHIGTIEVVIKATFKEGIDSEIHLSIMDRRINNLRDGCLGTMIGNLKEYIEIPRIFKEFAKVMTPDPIRIPKIGGVDIVIKDHPVLDRTMSSRIESGSRMSFSEDRITGYKGKEKDLARVLTPQEIRQPVIGRFEGMLEIAGHEFLVAGVAGRENGCMTLGISFLEDHKPWGRKAYIDSGSGICTAKPGVFPKEARETLPVIAGRDFSQKILILNTGIREAKIMIGGAFGTPWFRVMRRENAFNRIMPINFRSKRGNRDSSILIFHEESEEELKNLKEAIQVKDLDINEHGGQEGYADHYQGAYQPWTHEPGISAYSSPGFLVRNHGEIKRGILIDEAGIELQEHIVEKIRNFPDVLKDKKQLQSFLGVVNFAGIFIKDLAKYRKDFRPLLKETESAKWKWEEIHTQRVRELKQVCNNLPKLAIPQDEDELVVYTDANDYRWAAVLMKKTTGEEPCRYTGGLFTEQQAQVWHINEKEFFAVWKAFKKWPLFLLAKEFTLKVDNTNVKAFLKNKLESKIEKAQMEGAEANSVMLRLRHLRENLEELDREFGRLAVKAQIAGQVQRADLDKVQKYQEFLGSFNGAMERSTRTNSKGIALAADSSTACTRPSSDSGETATDESQEVKTSDDSSQPSTSGVKEGEISLRPMTGTSKTNTNEFLLHLLLLGRVWMMEGSKPEEVREWYEFGALASVHTMSPSFPEISKLPEWISGAVYDSWQNNPHLKRGDILELKFISAAPEMAGKGSHPAFHFIKLQRPDMVAFNRIKATTEEAPLVSAISEDDISTRRAWGLWVCLTEMDKVKYPFKNLLQQGEWIIPVKLHDRKEH